MPLNVIAGPAGGGKSQAVEAAAGPREAVIDFTRMHDALFPKLAGELRDPALLPFVEAVRMAAVREAAARQLDGYVTISDGRPERIEAMRQAAGPDSVVYVDDVMDEATARQRLAKSQPAGRSRSCQRATDRWFRNFPGRSAIPGARSFGSFGRSGGGGRRR